ncbi:MAG: alpha/beta fold hydrolase [Candidatus Moranbacteria bacterium]|nr:alpha/beta fold hydrolase [Candidatus Moranbacteria bacterium]
MHQKSAIIIHGFGASSGSNFFPWLKKELEKINYKVILEDFPDPFYPKLEAWVDQLKVYLPYINDNTIIIGHSLGGFVGAYFCSKINKKIKALYLVAPANPLIDPDGEIERNFAASGQKDQFEMLKTVFKSSIDWSKVHQNCQKILAFFSSDDPWIDLASIKYFKQNRVDYEILENRGHFLEFRFPEILNELKKNK